MSEQIQVGRSRLPTYLFDGFQVHRAALTRGLKTLLLPRQVLLAGQTSSVPSDVSFAHGVPEASTVSAVTYAQDRRLRRALLERAGIEVPKGATFTWRSVRSAGRWAEKLGFPVTVKEVVGENPARAVRDINSEEAVKAAFQALRLREPGDRSPGSNPLIAGYSTTRLGYMLDEDGEQVAPLRTRFLVEKQLSGVTIRALVCGGKLVAAVELDSDQGLGTREVTHTLHPNVSNVMVRAATTIPGLACAVVDVVIVDQLGAVVVELSERPRIHTFATADPTLGDRIGDALLEFQAGRAGLSLGGALTHVDLSARIEGLRDADAVASELPAKAEEHGVQLVVSEHDRIEGTVESVCSGTPDSIALVMELLMAGLLGQDRAACVEYSMGADNA